MDKPAIVALGAKDRQQASLGQRIKNHFVANRAMYASIAGGLAAGAGAAGTAYLGHVIGHRSGLERGTQVGYVAGHARGHENGVRAANEILQPFLRKR